jgi:hypothetical protein
MPCCAHHFRLPLAACRLPLAAWIAVAVAVAVEVWLEPEAAQFIQRCEAWSSREQQHTRRAAHMDVRRAPPGQDVPCVACLRLHRSRGHLIHKKAFFFGYLSFVALDKRK